MRYDATRCDVYQTHTDAFQEAPGIGRRTKEWEFALQFIQARVGSGQKLIDPGNVAGDFVVILSHAVPYHIQCSIATFGLSMISVSTPPMSLGWTKKMGVPWAPMRGSPSTLAPLPSNQALASSMSGTSKQR